MPRADDECAFSAAAHRWFLPLFLLPQIFHSKSQIHPQIADVYSARFATMQKEHCDFELWRESDWRCEHWSVRGRPQVRLYLGAQLVSELVDGPGLNLQRQTDEWRIAAHADTLR
jgi:hypothetical protein